MFSFQPEAGPREARRGGLENDEFRMQNGGRKVAISGAPIDAQGCGLSPVLSTQLFPAGVTPRETIF